MNRVVLTAAGIHKTYQMGKVPLKVLHGVDLKVHEGELLAITGASGCGKSTLLHILGALDVPDSGLVTMNKEDVFAVSAARRDRIRNQEVGFVFQFYHLLPELNVLENVLMPQMVACVMGGWWARKKAARDEACRLLDMVGLGDRIKHLPNELSGGERQRVAIARALINKPRFLLADEPTGNLDAKMGQGILECLRKLNESGQTMVLVTHDAGIAAAADRQVRLVDGKIRE